MIEASICNRSALWQKVAVANGRRGEAVNGFSIGEAWSQGVAFLSAHFKMILIYVAAGVLLPLIIQLLLIGGTMESMLNPQALMASGGDPLATFGALGAGFIIAVILGQIIQSASYFASWRHGLSGGVEEPASTVTYALGAAAMWLLATIALGIVAAVLIGLPFGLLGAGAAAGGDPSSMGGLALILIPVLLFLFLWLGARLSVTGPAMADARSANPLYGIATSWRLTGPSQWPIVGYLVVLLIGFIVLTLVLGMIAAIGMIGAGAAGGEMSAGVVIGTMISGIIAGIPIALAYVAIPAGIYRTLVPNNAGEVFA